MTRFLCIAAEPKDGTYCGACPYLASDHAYGCHLFGVLDHYDDNPKRHHRCKHAESLMLDKMADVIGSALRDAERAGEEKN